MRHDLAQLSLLDTQLCTNDGNNNRNGHDASYIRPVAKLAESIKNTEQAAPEKQIRHAPAAVATCHQARPSQ